VPWQRVKKRRQLVIENGAPEAIHFRMAAFAGPATKEKLTQITWDPKFWLMQLTARAIHGICINRNGRFGAVCHSLEVGRER